MIRVETIAQVRGVVARTRHDGWRVALVPTMGALHDGHLALVRCAARQADVVVVSIFVNPTQFDRADDLAAYPRDLDADEAALASLGLAVPLVVFAPAAAEMYPAPPRTTVHVTGITTHLCGADRPGHFDGVATVVTKLLAIVTPDVAVFGRKDYQQLQVVRRVVRDLDLPVRILAASTVREPDGLARSSRNRHLDVDGRSTAALIPQALRAVVLAARAARDRDEAIDADALRQAARRVLEPAALTIDYIEVVDPAELAPLAAGQRLPGNERVLVAVAVRIGEVRLIDNVEVGDLDDEDALLRATTLGEGQVDREADEQLAGQGGHDGSA